MIIQSEPNKKVSKNIKNLFLDPNNYRFVDNEHHRFVPDEDVLDPQIQKRSRNFIEGYKQENIKDLIASFKANGFLDVDIIQVKDMGDNNYLVLEGNRRVTALKSLQEDFERGHDIGKLDPTIFRSVPFEIHSNEENEKHLIIMGLKHISGNKKWSTLNQSKLIYDFLEPYKSPRDLYLEKENDLCNSLGISKTRLRTMTRIYHLILAYKESDYSEQFTPSMYGIFEEIIKKPVLKNWLDWTDDGYEARNKINQERLFSWISRTEQYVPSLELTDETDEEIESNEDYEEFEPIISKSLEIRELSLFITNESAIEIMERERSLARGLVSSGSVDKQNYSTALTKLSDSIRDLSQYKTLVTLEDTEQLSNAKEMLSEIIPKKSNLNIQGGNFSTTFEFGLREHFTKIKIEKYKIFKKFELDNLNKINIFAGFNNSGKTSLLEAIFLLTQQNDISSYFKLIRQKNKSQSLSPVHLNRIFNDKISISGIYNGIDTSVLMFKFEAKNIDKRDDYITSYELDSKIEDRELSHVVHTFVHETMQRINEKVIRLCPSSFKSPYFYDVDDSSADYSKSVETKVNFEGESLSAIKIIVEFLKIVDNSITDVRFTDDIEIKRFIVESTNSSEKDFDITTYGEGLQRIFSIALSFAGCKNGVLFIDEFETAIHYSLLVEFTRFVQKLSNAFNVQVFLTSHSNECIKAFINNGYNNEDITGYQLINCDGKITSKKVSGERFSYLVNNIDLDIRGDKND